MSDRRYRVRWVTGLLLMPLCAMGAEASARLQAYTFARIDADTVSNSVALFGFGKAEWATAQTVRGLRARLVFLSDDNERRAAVWVDAGRNEVWHGAVEKATGVPLEITFNPASTLRILSSCGRYARNARLVLEDARLVFSDGRETPLAATIPPDSSGLRSPPAFGPKTFAEPPTVRLSAETSDALVVDDWLAQRGPASCPEACRQELMRAERVFVRLSERLADGLRTQRRRELDDWKARLAAAPGDEAAYLELRRLKRRLLLGDPALDFSGVLCIDNPFSTSDHQTLERNAAYAVPGGRLLALEGLGPDAAVRKLAPDRSAAAFLRPDLSFDGKKALYCMKRSEESAYHIHEIGIDGQGERQLTKGDYDHIDPIYAPDGGLVFSTTRCNQFLPCGGSQFRMFILARCDIEGRNIRFISTNHESDYTPSFLPDGRILYTRWEYYDKSVSRVHSLWTVNPDGTAAGTLWGNQSRWPDMLLNAHAVPGSNKLLFNAGAHHDFYAGPIGVIDPNEGMNYPDGVYNLAPGVPWAEVGKGPADKAYNETFQEPSCYKAFQTPFPVSRDLFLVSARTGKSLSTASDPDPGWFRLYLMDYDGNMELLYQGAYNVLHAQPIRSRPRPRVVPSVVRAPERMTASGQQAEEGTLFTSDVYEGTTLPRGLVKALRILDTEPHTYSSARGLGYTPGQAAPYIRRGAFPGTDIVGEHGSSFIYADSPKRVLGTVPVEADGSCHFKVPSMRTVFFQLLDEKGRCLQTMRSATHVMPGEARGCTGCHETRAVVPPYGGGVALRRAPSVPARPSWGDATVSFPRFVQPVLDKHCVRCHGGTAPKGGLDLTHRTEPGSEFSWPYVRLVFGDRPKTVADMPKTTVAGPVFTACTYPNPEVRFPTQETVVPPMTAMSYKSRLIDIATSGKHHDVRVSQEEADRLIAWVDALCPYFGMEELLAQPDPDPKANAEFSYTARMRTAPMVHRAFLQDDFETQDDRLPKAADGTVLPSIEFMEGRRCYRIPATPLQKECGRNGMAAVP